MDGLARFARPVNGEFRALSLGSLAAILIAVGVWAAVFGPGDGSGYMIDADGPVLIRVVGESHEAEAAIGGMLALDGGCLHFGDSAAIVWPVGSAWDDDAQQVVLRTGTRLAVGDTVRGAGDRGAVPTNLSPEAREVLETCVTDVSDDAERVVWLNDRPEELQLVG